MEQPLFELYFDDSCKSLGIVQEGFSDTLRNIWNAIVTFFRTLWTNIVKMYNNAINTIKNWFKRLLGVDKIEEENAALKSQVQSMKADEERYKKDLADANAKLKDLEETKKTMSSSLSNANQKGTEFKRKEAQLEMDKKCLEKYIEYLQAANKPCTLNLDRGRYEETIQLIQRSNDLTVELCKKAVQIVTDLKNSNSFDDFINHIPGVDSESVDYIDIAVAYIGGDDEVDNHDANIEMLKRVKPTPILAKHLNVIFNSCVHFTNVLRLEYLKLKKINIEKEIPKYSNDDNNTSFDKESIEMVNKAIRFVSMQARKYQNANQDIISNMTRAIGDFTNLYKNIQDIDFYLKYDGFKNKYLDEDGEFTPEIKAAIDAVNRFR